MTDRPANRAEFVQAISYALRFTDRGKPTDRHREMSSQMAAEHLAEQLDRAGYVITQRAPALGMAETAGRRERGET